MCNWSKSKLGAKREEIKRIISLFVLLLTLSNVSAMDNMDTVTKADSDSDSIIVNNRSAELISRNLFVELWGPSFGIGLGYDQRFKPNSPFGFRVGIAYTNGNADGTGYWDNHVNTYYSYVEFKGVTFPLEANAILGNRASKFELGIGATPCILDRYEMKYSRFGGSHSSSDIRDGVRLNIFGTMNIGYRLQRNSGFFFRVGLTFMVGDLDCSPFDGLLCWPNISFGYTIR